MSGIKEAHRQHKAPIGAAKTPADVMSAFKRRNDFHRGHPPDYIIGSVWRKLVRLCRQVGIGREFLDFDSVPHDVRDAFVLLMATLPQRAPILMLLARQSALQIPHDRALQVLRFFATLPGANDDRDEIIVGITLAIAENFHIDPNNTNAACDMSVLVTKVLDEHFYRAMLVRQFTHVEIH